jgi:hypothetical protein
LGTYYWGNLARLDVLQGPPGLRLAVHGPPCLPVLALPLQPAEGKVLSEQQVRQQQALAAAGEASRAAAAGAAAGQAAGAAAAPAAAGQVAHRPLKLKWEKELAAGGGGVGWRCVGDISVSGVHGWLALHVQGAWRVPIRLRAWAPAQVEAFMRFPMPVPGPFEQRQRQEQQRPVSEQQQQAWAGRPDGSSGWASDGGAAGGDSGWVEAVRATGSAWGEDSGGGGSSGGGAGDQRSSTGRRPAAGGAASKGRRSSSSGVWDPFEDDASELLTCAEMDQDLARFGLDAIYGGERGKGASRAPGGAGGGGGAQRGQGRGRGRGAAGRGGRGRSGGGGGGGVDMVWP